MTPPSSASLSLITPPSAPSAPSALSLLLKLRFPGKRFLGKDKRTAGKILKKFGEEGVVEYLKDKDCSYDVRPPAKCNIVAMSRPFSEWPIFQLSKDIQLLFYGMTSEEFNDNKYIGEPGVHQANYVKWMKDHNINARDFLSAQALALIFKHSVSIYRGVIEKVKNRNNKKRKKIDVINEKRRLNGEKELEPDEEKAFDDTGHLVYPPGVNGCIYCCQRFSPKVYESDRDVDIHSVLPVEYYGYKRKSDDQFEVIGKRLDIAKGLPGYVPQDIHVLNHHRQRIRKYWGNLKTSADARAAKACDSILYVIRIGDDWLLVDGRGLLRNVRWRKLAPKSGLTLQGLLGLFSGDPVVDTKRNVVTFIYSEGVVPIQSENTIRGKYAKDRLERLIEKQQVGVISIDLGQTNPVAAKVSRITHDENGELRAETVSRMFLSDLPGHLDNEILSYRKAYDALEIRIHQKAVDSLSVEQRQEYDDVIGDSAQKSKQRLCKKYGLDEGRLPWDKMNGFTFFISDAILAGGGDEELVFFKSVAKKTKVVQIVKRRDFLYTRLEGIKNKLSEVTRKFLNEKIWELKRLAPEYEKLVKRKSELSRRCANEVVAWGRRMIPGVKILVNIEDLNVGFFHGSGKRDSGWDDFFVSKRENRWLIQVLHKAFSDLGPHQGITVFESFPQRTSITCPSCGYCDDGNRNGEKFLCLKCGIGRHADLEVATDNLERVLLTGMVMPKPEEPGKKRASGRVERKVG